MKDITVPLNILVRNRQGEKIAGGMLNVPDQTFTPDGGELAFCTGFHWPTTAGDPVRFIFQVTDRPNGPFPLGKDGRPHNYNFVGVQDHNGFPHGEVNFPGQGTGDDDNDTWQAGASADEPYARGQGAS